MFIIPSSIVWIYFPYVHRWELDYYLKLIKSSPIQKLFIFWILFYTCFLPNHLIFSRIELAKCIANPSCAANVACLNTCNNRPDETECQVIPKNLESTEDCQKNKLYMLCTLSSTDQVRRPVREQCSRRIQWMCCFTQEMCPKKVWCRRVPSPWSSCPC